MNAKIIKMFFIILISILYLSSAYNKITNFNTVADGLKQKINSSILFNWIPNFGYDISKLALLFGIFLLLSGPLLIIYGVYNDENSFTKYGAWLLILFLILATILYHPITDPKQVNNFLKNLSLVGGLGFMVVQC